MGSKWMQNLCGFRIDETGMRTIPHPKTELVLHVTTKTVQAGGFLGTLMVGPALAAIKGPRDMDGVKSWSQTCGTYGVLIGLMAGPLMTQMKIASASNDSIWDRCYRIRYNKCQVRVDQLSAVGAIAGCAAASYLGDNPTLGALVGMNGGMIIAALFNATLG